MKPLFTLICSFLTILSINAQTVATDTLKGDEVINNTTSYINTNKTIGNTKIWILKGFVYVRPGATLTIEKGALIKGDKATKGTIIVMRGGKILAEGTKAQPIVFTSNQPVGQRDAGDWGGIILLGKAPTNASFKDANGATVAGQGTIEGGVNNASNDGLYGGTDADDNSGILKYVRIEFPGIAFQPNNEINGLTFGGVGRGTNIQYVQVSFSGDDSYEWFGGTVDAKYIVAFGGVDDDFDTDNGFSGRVQFGLAARVPGYSDKTVVNGSSGASNGFESDNNEGGQYLAPYTSATFSNMTMIGVTGANQPVGDVFRTGALLRRNTRQSVFNSIMMGWPSFGVDIDGVPTAPAAIGDTLRFKNNMVASNKQAADAFTGTPTITSKEWLTRAAYSNDSLSTDLLTAPYDTTKPNFALPKAGSAALTGAAFTDTYLNNAYFTQVAYRGAFGPTNWLEGWASFTPKSNPYLAPITSKIAELDAQVFGAKIYPNPAQGIANIEFNVEKAMNMQISLVDMLGREVSSTPKRLYTEGVYNTALNLNNTPAGLYLVRFISEDGQKTMPLSVIK